MRKTTAHRGFSLIELLVVVAIIAALLTILLPSLGKSREYARRSVCASNMHQWGLACINYAATSGGHYPIATVWSGGTQPYMIVEKGGGGYSAGTNIKTLRKHGLADSILRCPSSRRMDVMEPVLRNIGYSWSRSRLVMKQNYNAADDTGTQVRMEDYAFIANANNYVGPNRFPPARRASESGPNAIFVGDMVDWNGWANAWGETCHPGPDGLVELQNLSMVDGSVRALTAADYDRGVMKATPTSDVSIGWGLACWYFEGVR